MQTFSPSLLIAGNTASQTLQYASYLEAQGLGVRCVYTGSDIITSLRDRQTDLIVMDMALPGGDALWVLDHLGLLGFTGKAIVLIADETDPRLDLVAGRAVLLLKPAGMAKLHQAVALLLSHETASLPEDLAGTLTAENAGADKARRPPEFGGFIGTSPAMQALYEQIQNGARSTATVFITGESGTGKEVCAQAIHKYSQRAEQSFVPLNCAAIPRDLLESEIFGHVRGAFTGAVADRDGAAAMADDGTLFLDEIGEMDKDMQTKLLRFLQDGTFQRVGGNRLERVDVRIICATNRDPWAEVKAGRFREDLFYRLHVIPIAMPPLRMRGGDIIDIAQTLLLRYAAEEGRRFRGFSPDAEHVLSRYPWPGNIRQLQNIIRHAVVMNDGIALNASMLPAHLRQLPEDRKDGHAAFGGGLPVRSPGDPDGSARISNDAAPIVPLHIIERRAIERAICACHGNIPRAAALLQVSPSTLYRKKAQWDGGGAIPAINVPIHDTAHGF